VNISLLSTVMTGLGRPVWKIFIVAFTLSLSFDHRVIDGADGARFLSYINGVLADLRRLVM